MRTAKSYEIPKRLVWEAYKRVKANGGAAGVDEQSLLEFEGKLGNNLYRIWNRMSSGSYFPPPVKAVAIPKKSGGERILGVPTVSDRIPKVPFCRYADDGLIHCRSQGQAQFIRQRLADRLKECGLELHPDKTKVVYCRDIHRQKEYETIQFDFLGYTFRFRRSEDRYGRVYVNFTPAISRAATKALRQEIRGWRVQLKSDKSIEDLSRMFAPVIRGWINYYYCRFYPAAFKPVADRLNMALTCWAMRKFKQLRGHKRRARHWIGRVTHRQPGLFPHWRAGFVASAGTMGAG
jgi:RNA-directed DNA polymerase